MADDQKTMDISLRIKADAKQAVDSMQQVRAEIEKTQATAAKTTASTSSLDKAIDNVAATSKTAAKAVEQNAEALGNVSDAATGASRSANAMGRGVSNLATNLARGNLKGAATDAARFGGAALSAEAAVAAMSFAVVGTVAVLATFAFAMLKGEQETLKFNQALVSTGNFAGATAGQLVDMTNRIGAVTGRYGDAAAALTALTSTGKFARAQLDQLTQTAVEFATMTGGKVADGVKFVDSLMSGNIQTVAKLDQQYHFLTATQLDEIQRLMDQGEQERALGLVQQVASKAVHDRAEEVQANAGIMIRAWDGVKSAASTAWAAMKNVGAAQSTGTQLKTAMDALAAAQATHFNTAQQLVPNATPQQIAALQAKVNDLRHQLVTQGFEQTQKAVNDSAETNAKAAAMTAEAWLSPIDKLHKDLDAAAKAKDDFFLVPHDSATTERFLRSYNNQIQQIAKTYDSATKTPAAKKPKVDRSAEQIARQAAAAQNALTQALIQQQAALSPTAAIWAKYNATVEKANQDAATAKLAHGANADSINGVRDGVIAAAGAVRDAALDQLAEKDREAWEKLKKSIESPMQARLDGFIAQLEQIDSLIAKKPSRASDFQALLGDAIGKSLPQRPGGLMQFARQSPVAALGAAPDAENDYFANVQKQLEAERTAALAKAVIYNQSLLAVNKRFDAEQETQARIHQQMMADIETAKASFALDTAQQGFSALTQAMATAYGENSKQARAAFALEKAASIAKAVLAINTSIAESSKIGFPWNVVAIAGAIAQGIALVANVRSVSFDGGGGYAGGGAIRGPGTGTSDSIPMWGSNGEYMQREAAVRYYGIDFMDAVNNLRFPKVARAEGGLIAPFANAPSPAQLGFQSPTMPRADFSQLAAANDGASSSGRPAPTPKVLVFFDKESVMDELAKTSAFEKASVHVVGDNPRAIRGKWGG